jgi:regulatory protein
MNEIASQLEQKALELLARREHGVQELAEKLRAKVIDASESEIEMLLATLQAKGWLSEQRFVETALEQYRRRGDGPLKIRHKLAAKLAEPWRLDEALALSDAVWADSAREVLIKKFGSAEKPREPKEVARRLRFLQGRGFTQTQCWAAFE